MMRKRQGKVGAFWLRAKIVPFLAILTVLFGVAAVVGVTSTARASTTITVQGAVSCTSHPLVGVWVQSSGGGSRFAGWSKSSSNGYDGIFSTTISTALPTTLQLHVGCGGSTSSWWSDNWTPGKSVSGLVTLEASCNEGASQPPKGANSRCGFTSTSAQSAAVNWAKPYAAAHSTAYNGKCLTFVFNAYSAAGIDLRKWVNVSINASTYPQDIWGHFTYGLTGTDTPPSGALVFFNETSGHSTKYHVYSHVELSVGGGNMISTSDTVAGYTHYETLAQHAAVHPWNTYVGWWLPA